jgi:hypothetical protein
MTIKNFSVKNGLTAGNITLNATTSTISTSGNITVGNANLGNSVTANFFIGDGGRLSNISATDGNAITNGNSNIAVSQNSNITVSVSGNANIAVFSGTGINIAGYTTITGDLTAANANLGNLVIANYFSGNGSQLTGVKLNVSESNGTGGNVTNSISSISTLKFNRDTGIFVSDLGEGTALVSLGSTFKTWKVTGQPDLVAVGEDTVQFIEGSGITISTSNVSNLKSITFTSNNVANANYANIAGTANSVAGANVSGQVANALIAGTVYTNAQPNITSVGTLSSLSVSGDANVGNLNTVNAVLTGNLTVQGNTTYVNVDTLVVQDPIIEMGGGANGDPLTTNDGKDRGSLLHYYSGAPVDAFMGWDNSNAEFAFGSNVTVSADVVTYNALGNVRANYFIGNGSQLTGLPASYTDANVAAYLPTYTGNLTAGNANLGNVVIANYFSGDGGLLSNLATSTSLINGNSNVRVAENGNVSLSMSGNANVIVFTSQGANINGYANITGNVTFGNLQVTTSANLGSISGLTITGGSNNYVLQTNGSGNLSWAPLGALVTVDSFSGNGAQTTFTLSATPASIDYTLINVNGAQQFKDSYSLTGNSLTFSEAPPNTSSIEVTTFAQRPTVSGYVNRKYIGNGSGTTYTVTSGCGENDVLVFLNGVCQMPVDAYTISGSNLTFAFIITTGTEIQIRELPR